MTFNKHAAVSITAGAILLLIYKDIRVSISCLAIGVLLDLDHVLDYYANGELREISGYLFHPRKLVNLLKNGYERKSAQKVYKLLHSIELAIPALILYLFGIWNQIVTGLFAGFILHIAMDFLPIGHIAAISMISKARRGFPTGGELLKQRLSKINIDIDKCQSCDAGGMMFIHKPHPYAGFTKKGLSKLKILCSDCHEKAHDRENNR